MHNPAMPVLDDAIVHPRCYAKQDSTLVPSPPRKALRKAISIPAVSTLVKDSFSWAGDTLNSYRDGLTPEQRKQRAQAEDRKQVLYLKIKNVSRTGDLGIQMVPGLWLHLRVTHADQDLDCRRCRTKNGAVAPVSWTS